MLSAGTVKGDWVAAIEGWLAGCTVMGAVTGVRRRGI